MTVKRLYDRRFEDHVELSPQSGQHKDHVNLADVMIIVYQLWLGHMIKCIFKSPCADTVPDSTTIHNTVGNADTQMRLARGFEFH